MFKLKHAFVMGAAAVALTIGQGVVAQDKSIVVASTTSTQDSPTGHLLAAAFLREQIIIMVWHLLHPIANFCL